MPLAAFSAYTILKFFHIVMAIIAVGFNASYGIWLGRAAREPEHDLHVLRGVKFLDDRFANPAYGLLLVTGISMVLVGHLSFATFWIAMALGLYGLLLVMGALVYTPTLRRQIQVLQSHGAGSTEYRRLAARGQAVGILLAVIVIGIVFLIVTKPTF
ncbi:MAG TPA: DUF2269 family protein [Actinomycetota bacterium]|nr:DUF2269 family protein [Actinomycetota bacterium]